MPPSISTVRSPRDETPIFINGKMVDLESQIEARINKASPVIKPSSPNKMPLPMTSNNLSTPAVLPYNDVNIVDSPAKDLEENFIEKEEEISPAINISMDFNSLLLNKINQTPEKKKEVTPPPPFIPPPPVILNNPKVEINLPIKREFKAPEIEVVRPFVPKPIIPESKYESDSSFSVDSKSSKGSSISNSSDNSVENFNEEQAETSKFPLPVFSYKPRIISPIQTLNAPKSPSPRIIPKNSSINNTPALTPINATPNIKTKISEDTVPVVKNPFNRAPSPPVVKQISSPVYKVASPVRPKSPIVSPPKQSYIPQPEPTIPKLPETEAPVLPQPTYIPPQYQQTDEHMLYGYGQPDYSRLTSEQQNYLKAQFKVKFSILRANYPQWGIIEIHDSFTLEQINELYTYYIRQIMVSKETGNYKVYLVIFFMIIEVIGVKILKLNMSGYTMSQLRRMNQYDSLLSELGEKWLVGGGSNWPVEARLLVTAATNAVIFLGVKYLCGWMGVDGLADTIQNFFDSMINGPENTANSIAPSSSAPIGMNLPKNATVSTGEEQQQTTNPLDAISGVIGNLFGGNKSGGGDMASGFADTVAKLGTMFTSKVQNNNKAQAEAKQNTRPTRVETKTQAQKKKLNKKSLFSD